MFVFLKVSFSFRNGASIQELEETLAEAIRKYESAQKDIQDIGNLNKVGYHIQQIDWKQD